MVNCPCLSESALEITSVFKLRARTNTPFTGTPPGSLTGPAISAAEAPDAPASDNNTKAMQAFDSLIDITSRTGKDWAIEIEHDLYALRYIRRARASSRFP